MLIFLTLKKLIQILNDKASPSQIAGAVALAAFVGLQPGFTLFSLFFFLLIFLANVNLGAAFFAMALFKPVGYLADGWAHRIGWKLLTQVESLKPFWTALYDLPFVPFTRFNNTVVLGDLVIGGVLFIPLFIAVKLGVIYYRAHILERLQRLKIIQIMKASDLYGWYEKVKRFKD